MKKLITPKQSCYQVRELAAGVSVSHPVKTLDDARKIVEATLNFAKNIHVNIEKMSIVFLEWPAWHKGEPSPEPTETLVWKSDYKNNGGL